MIRLGDISIGLWRNRAAVSVEKLWQVVDILRSYFSWGVWGLTLTPGILNNCAINWKLADTARADDSCIPKNCGSEVGGGECQDFETVSQECASLHKAHKRCGELCFSDGMWHESCTRNGGSQGHGHDDNPQVLLVGQLQPFQELSEHFFYYHLLRERMKPCMTVSRAAEIAK